MDIFFPLQWAAEWLAYGVFSLSPDSHLGQSVAFFFYDTAKIIILVYGISILSGIVNHYLPVERIRDYLSTHKLWGLDYFFATIFGAITPFCSCSSIPLFIGFLKAGIPLGVTFAYLISSPLISEIAFALLIGLFGIKIALLYVLAGSVIGMIGGFVIGRLTMEKYVEDFVRKTSAAVSATETRRTGLREAFPGIVRESSSILWGILPYVLIGIGVGAAIHGFVPADFFEFILTRLGVFSLPAVVLIAVPMYANPAGVLPILESLVAKGIPMGTALAFMMAIVGLSLPAALILKKVIKWPLLLAFFGTVTVGIILLGYLFNFLFA
jgi:uncharacterized membrane protein YraQ (UPF0718 family)